MSEIPPEISYKTFTITDFNIEIILAFIFLTWFFCHYHGSNRNKQYAIRWLQATLDTWKQQFSLVHVLVKDGPRDYIFYASGRNHIKYVYGFINLIARHDPIEFLMNYIQGIKMYDRLKLEISFRQMDDFVFCVLPKKNAPKTIKERWDFSHLKTGNVHGFPKENYVTMTDSPPILDAILSNPKIKSTLFKAADKNEKLPLIEEIICSDLPSVMPKTIDDLQTKEKIMTITFRLPKLSDVDSSIDELLNEYVEFAMELVDAIGETRLTLESKQKTKRLRVMCEDLILKSNQESIKEALEQKKIQKRKEKEKEVSLLSVEAQRKYDQKLKKEKLKARKPTMKKMS